MLSSVLFNLITFLGAFFSTFFHFLDIATYLPFRFKQIMRIAKRTPEKPGSTDQFTNKTYTTRLGKRGGREEERTDPEYRMMGKKAYMLRIGKRTSRV